MGSIISLGAYDAILGMDWLKKHSPMYVDWEAHHLYVTTDSGPIELQAVTQDLQQCSVISSQEFLHSCKQGAVAYVVHLNTVADQGVADSTIPTEIDHLPKAVLVNAFCCRCCLHVRPDSHMHLFQICWVSLVVLKCLWTIEYKRIKFTIILSCNLLKKVI